MSILEMLVEELGLDASEVIRFANTAPYRYKVYQIPKRNGQGTRTIAHPSKNLKYVQRLLVQYLRDKLPIHDRAFAYVEGRSIKDNAAQHVNSRYLLKMDFRQFFPSITSTLFDEKLVVVAPELDDVDRELLSRLLFRRRVRGGSLELSIGAPSSPMVSNFVMYDFDVAITALCEPLNIEYTRYADDLTFSSSAPGAFERLPYDVAVTLHETTRASIDVNHEKTIHSSKAHNRHVTGVTLTNDGGLSIGRSRKRLISSMIHKFSHKQLPQEDVPRLLGLIAFATQIEPDFYQRMVKKYGQDVLDEIKRIAGNR